jgi:hypothetical protein
LAEGVAFGCSFFVFRNGMQKHFQIFPMILGTVFICEVLGGYWGRKYGNNLIIYEALGLVWPILYLFIYWFELNNPKRKLIIAFFFVIYYLSAISNFFYDSGAMLIINRSSVLGSIFILFVSINYLWEVTNSFERLELKSHSMFWISFSMVIFFFPFAIIMGGFEYFRYMELPVTQAYGYLYRVSINVLCNIHYYMLAYGFICPVLFKDNFQLKS